jgi:Tannase and feruloyl esterase
MRLLKAFAVAMLFGSTLTIALTLTARSPIAATACSGLVGLSLVDGTVTSATDITAPFTTTANSNAATAPTITVSAPFPFCKVTTTLTPTADSSIQTELWMPDAPHWNGKFLGVGNGALTGAIWHTSMVRPLQAGYAVANSDLGHPISSANWALGHPEKVLDYANRADHVTALASKAIVRAFYGHHERLSYFHGCSNGGHQALMEAQRYPDDYDAIIAGAPWNQWTHQNVEFISRALALESLNPAKQAMITSAVVAQCGGRDGGVLADGYLNDPQSCHFNPASLLCAGADAPTCLTATEVAAVKKVYAGPSDPKTRLRLFPGFERGSEFGWIGFGAFINNLWQNMIVEDPSFDFHTFDFTNDVAFFDAKLAATINSTDPDLGPFKARGGKLLMWHGWTDTTLEPRSSLNYYNSVVAVTGGGLRISDLRDDEDSNRDHDNDRRGHDSRHERHDSPRENLEDTQDFFRLFLAPGVNHCGGGAGPNSSFAYTLANAVGPLDADHDILAALDRWVEHRVAPSRLIASHFTAGVADKTRPICAYPKMARYKGKGDPNQPGAWVCADGLERFESDYADELRNIRSDVKTGNLDNLPNGGFVKKSSRH